MRLLLCVMASGLLLSCQKEIGFTENTDPEVRRLQLDSMRYVYIDGATGQTTYTSTWFPQYARDNSLQITRVVRLDTFFASWNTVVYVDKDYFYNGAGKPTRILSRSRFKTLYGDPSSWVLNGNSPVENYRVDYAYAQAGDPGFPNEIRVRVFSDSTASRVMKDQLYYSAIPFSGAYFSRQNYYITTTPTTTEIRDADSSFWLPYGIAADSANHFVFRYNAKGQVSELTARLQRGERTKAEVRAHLDYNDEFFRLLSVLQVTPSGKHLIALNRLTESFDVFSDHAPNRQLVNQLKNYSLSSSDSLVLLNDDGFIGSLVETNRITGTVIPDASGRIRSVIRQGEKLRTLPPAGQTRYVQKFEFFYKF